jgi:protein phosphatase 2C family protein 2/3
MKQNKVTIRDKSGACAIVMLIIDNKIWIANTGDSRAIMSSESGTRFETISNDHKPSEDAEKTRIIKAGGEVY